MARFYTYGKESWVKDVYIDSQENFDQICKYDNVPYISKDTTYVVTRFHKNSLPPDNLKLICHYQEKTISERFTGKKDIENSNPYQQTTWEYGKMQVEKRGDYVYYLLTLNHRRFHSRNILKIESLK
jgi:hypothetical protein